MDTLSPIYNMSLDAFTTKGTKRTLETRAILSAKAKLRDKQPSGGDAHMAKAIIQFDMDGNKIRQFGCISDATREGFGAVTNISRVCNGKNNSHRGYVYKYV